MTQQSRSGVALHVHASSQGLSKCEIAWKTLRFGGALIPAMKMGTQKDQAAWTLRRSCNACARAKTRCDLLSSGCSRCLKKKTRCVYTNEPLGPRKDSSVARQQQKVAAHGTGKHGARATAHRSLGDSFVLALQNSNLTLQRPSFHGVPLTLDNGTVQYIFMHLASFPTMFAKHGRTPFIDLQIYDDSLPESIQDTWSICASAVTSSSVNKALLNHSLDSKTVQLIYSAKDAASFADLLASLQALILALIMRLFTCNLGDSLSVGALLDTLGKLTFRLWQQAPARIPASLTPRQAWLFAESVRRTILTSHLLRGTWSVFSRGYFLHTAFVEALPFDVRTSLWDSLSDPVQWPAIANFGTKMVSYREYTDMWECGQIHGATKFGTLLLVACKGKDAVKAGLPRNFIDNVA